MKERVNTVFYRTERGGNAKRKVIKGDTQEEIKSDMFSNGFIVIVVVAGEKSFDWLDKWEFKNRK